MSDLSRIAPGLLEVGKPLPWPVYDEHGSLLVSQGFVLQNETQLEKLYERGRYVPPHRLAERLKGKGDSETPRASPFAEYPLLLYELESVLESVVNARPESESRVEHLARRLHNLCAYDTDACIALVHVYAIEPSAYEQQVFYAIICWLAAHHFQLNEQRTLTLLKAALTANIALLPFLDTLNRSNKTLSDEQRVVIQKHPVLGAQALGKAGFESSTCRTIVEQHHERFDGQGYPGGLSGDDILVEAKVLGLAERYTAMITKRAYRDRFRADHAQAEIQESMAEDPHQIVYNAVFRELTPYPPGVLVVLNNSETAMITHRRYGSRSAVAQALFNSQGKRYLGPLKRDTSEEAYQIHKTLTPNMLPSVNLALMWGYG